MRYGTSLIATPTKILAERGATGLFRGTVTSVGREGVFTLGYLGVGPALQGICKKDLGLGPAPAAIAGAVGGGVLASVLSHPM